jgi:hypothetical protein
MTEVLRTLSEIRATATKAARGAGFDWGMAEEAGLAARVLESRGLPGVRVLARLLNGRACCDRVLGTGARNGMWEMVALSDRLPFPEEAMPTGPVAAPLLLAAPLILFARERGLAFTLAWDGAMLRCTPEGVTAHGAVGAETAERVSLEPSPDGHTEPCPIDWRSRAVRLCDWDRLEHLAARTLVPETAASRARGAGPADAAAD